MTFTLSLLFLFSAGAGAAEKAVVGSKAFSESIILAEMAAILLEEKGVEVERKTNLGGTKVVFDALKAGDIDFYPEYTGTAYIMLLKRSKKRSPQEVYKIVSKEFASRHGLIWSPPLGFDNTYALAVRADDERFDGAVNISDLSGKVSGMTLAAPHEFMERKDGFDPFKKRYRLEFGAGNVKAVNSGLMYSAIKNGQADLVMSYSTDGRLGAYNLRVLNDDKNFFPPYGAAFVAREELPEKVPQIKEVFKTLAGKIGEKDMAKLNDLVDRLKREPALVAKNFLVEKGLIKGSLQRESSPKGFFEYAFQKREYLAKIAAEHLALSFGALFLAVAAALPMGVLMARLPLFAKLAFPAVNTLQTIPSLALLGFLIPFLGIGYPPALLALFLYSLLPLVRNTFTGIQAVDKDYIEASRGLGLTERQILWKVELPLAAPIILAGVRTASVIVIGTATLAALAGAGGLGDPIFRGVATVNGNLILLGAIPSALLAVCADKLLGLAERKLVSKGLRV